jgi:hypothetical protein
MGTCHRKPKCSLRTNRIVFSEFYKTYSFPSVWILNSEKLFVIFCLTILAIPSVRLGKLIILIDQSVWCRNNMEFSFFEMSQMRKRKWKEPEREAYIASKLNQSYLLLLLYSSSCTQASFCMKIESRKNFIFNFWFLFSMQECSLCDLGIIYILFTQFNDHAPFEFHSCFSKRSIVVIIIIMHESFILRHQHLLPLSLTVVYKEKVSVWGFRFNLMLVLLIENLIIIIKRSWSYRQMANKDLHLTDSTLEFRNHVFQYRSW